MFSKKYNGHYIFIYKSKHGSSNAPFIINELDDEYINMTLVWDLNFNLITHVGEKHRFKIYANKSREGLNHSFADFMAKRKSKNSIFKFNF